MARLKAISGYEWKYKNSIKSHTILLRSDGVHFNTDKDYGLSKVGVLYQEEGTPHFIVRCPLLNGWGYCDCCIAVLAQYFSRCLLLWLLYCSTGTILQQMRLMCLYCSTCTILQQNWLLYLYYVIGTFYIYGNCTCYTAVLTQYFNICCYYGCCAIDCTLLSWKWLLWLLEQQLWLLCMEHMS